MGLPGRHGYQGLLDWEVPWPFLKGMDITSSREEILEHFYTGGKTYFFSQRLLRLYFLEVWDVRLRLSMMKFSPEYIRSLF